MLGFKEEEIKVLSEPLFKEIQKGFLNALSFISDNKNEGNNTMVFVYYAGHGQSDNYTYAMVNEGDRQYPLE